MLKKEEWGSWDNSLARATRGRGLPSLDARSWIIPPTPIKWLLAAALLDRLFEHPETIEASVVYERFIRSFVHKPSFSAAC